MNRAVIDTNVLVSGLLAPHGAPGRIVEWLRQGAVQAVLDDRLAGEYQDVLIRPALGLDPHEVGIVLEAIRTAAAWVEVPAGGVVAGLPDPDDAPFLECAQVAAVPLVTGNLKHYPKRLAADVRILSPAEFVRLVGTALL